MTRLGKVARLPCEIREQLNVRLRNGEVGRQLVEWLNGLPETQAILAAQFGGRPINEQNLTEWKQGGYEDWIRNREDCSYARILIENAYELEKEAGKIRLENVLPAPLALALTRAMREIIELPESLQRQKALVELSRELAQLRRVSHEAERVRMESERWEMKKAEAADKKRRDAESAAQWEKIKAQRPDLFGHHLNPGGPLPQEMLVCLEASERLRSATNGESQMGRSQQRNEVNQGKSNQINAEQIP